MNYDKECERLMKANAELSLLREFVAEVREIRDEIQRNTMPKGAVAHSTRMLTDALARLDDGRKG